MGAARSEEPQALAQRIAAALPSEAIVHHASGEWREHPLGVHADLRPGGRPPGEVSLRETRELVPDTLLLALGLPRVVPARERTEQQIRDLA